MTTMLAAVYHGPQDLRVEEVPLPEIAAGELLLKVHSASICGTDLRIYHGNHRKYPAGTVRIPGHEVVGEIAAIGAGSAGIRSASASSWRRTWAAATAGSASAATTTAAPTTARSA